MYEPEPAAAEAEAAELVPAEEPAVEKQDTDAVHPAEAEEQPAAQEGWFDLFPVMSICLSSRNAAEGQ